MSRWVKRIPRINYMCITLLTQTELYTLLRFEHLRTTPKIISHLLVGASTYKHSNFVRECISSVCHQTQLITKVDTEKKLNSIIRSGKTVFDVTENHKTNSQTCTNIQRHV